MTIMDTNRLQFVPAEHQEVRQQVDTFLQELRRELDTDLQEFRRELGLHRQESRRWREQCRSECRQSHSEFKRIQEQLDSLGSRVARLNTCEAWSRKRQEVTFFVF